MVPRRYASHRMSAAARDFTHDGCALLRLQIEGELLPSGKGSVRGEDIHRFIDETLSRNPGECPVLMGLIIVASGEVVDMGWLSEKIGNHEIDHAGIAAMVLTQVKDERIRVGHEAHRGDDCRSAEFRRREGIEFDVSDIVVQDFKLGKSAILMLEHGAEARFLGWAWFVRSRCRTRRLGHQERIVSNKEMLIMADTAKVAAEGVGEFVAVGDRIVVAMLLMIMNGLNHFCGYVGIHIVLGQLLANGINGLLPNSRVNLNIIELCTRRKRTDV